MKKWTITLLFLLVAGMVYPQSRESKLRETRGKWELDENGKVAFREVFEFPGKSQDELMGLAERYFVHTFTDNPIEEFNVEGGFVRARATFSNVHYTYRVYDGDKNVSTVYNAVVEVRAPRVRVSVILHAYVETTVPDSSNPFVTDKSYEPASWYPVNPRGGNKAYSMNVFYNSYKRAMGVINGFREFVVRPAPEPATAPGRTDEWWRN